MESNMVKRTIDNTNCSMASNKAIELIECFFSKNLPHFQLEQKYEKNEGYYGAKFTHKNMQVFIGSGRGYLEAYINLDGEDIPLWKFDREILRIESLNENNINYVLRSVLLFFS